MQWIRAKAIAKEGQIIGIASDETLDRAGDVILATAWDLENFKKNPVLLWAHDYTQPPIGKVVDIKVEDGKLTFIAEPAPTDFGREVYELYSKGYLNAFSVGFLPVEYDVNPKTGGYTYKKVELLEISAVPVPANPNALAVLRAKGISPWDKDTPQRGGEEMETEEKAVIPYKKRPLAPEDTPWDAAREVRRATVDDLKIMCTWYDEENPDVKQAYKLPHHMADKSKDYPTVWRGVAAAMAALFGARGGVKIPEKDKKGVYDHLAAHYNDFGKEPPEWGKSWDEVKHMFEWLTDEEIDAMIKTMEEAGGGETMEEEVKTAQEPTDGKDTAVEEKDMAPAEEKAGAVLSRRNAEKLMNLAGKVQEAIKVLDEAVAELTDFVETAMAKPQDNNTEEPQEEPKLYTLEEVKALLEEYRKTLMEQLGGEDA